MVLFLVEGESRCHCCSAAARSLHSPFINVYVFVLSNVVFLLVLSNVVFVFLFLMEGESLAIVVMLLPGHPIPLSLYLYLFCPMLYLYLCCPILYLFFSCGRCELCHCCGVAARSLHSPFVLVFVFVLSNVLFVLVLSNVVFVFLFLMEGESLAIVVMLLPGHSIPLSLYLYLFCPMLYLYSFCPLLYLYFY